MHLGIRWRRYLVTDAGKAILVRQPRRFIAAVLLLYVLDNGQAVGVLRVAGGVAAARAHIVDILPALISISTSR